MDDLKEVVDTYFSQFTKLGIILVILSSLFLFNNFTTEFYDSAKFLVLLIIAGILLILIATRFTLHNKIVILRTPLDIPLLLLLAVGIVSTILSPAPYVSLLGNQLKLHGSLVSLIVYIIFYFVLVNSIKTAKEVKWIFIIATFAASILSVISLLAYSGIKLLPEPWVHGINFTTTGSSFTTTAILALLLPFVVSHILSKTNNITFTIINSVIFTLFGMTIALTGTWVTWMPAIIGVILTVAASPLRQVKHINQINPISLVAFVIPLSAIFLITILSFVPPISKINNPLYTQAQVFPKEIQSGLITSWKVAVSAFRDTPFWGSGPSTYLFDFTNYKPLEFNSSKDWNTRSDSAFNEYLQILATLGGVGLIAFISLTALFVSSAYSVIASPAKQSTTNEIATGSNPRNDKDKMALTISGLIFFIILALHASTLVVWVFGLLILAAFYVVNLSSANSSKSWNNEANIQTTFLKIAGNITSTNSSRETIKVDALPSILLTIVVAVVLFAFYYTGKFTIADYHHRMALNAISADQGLIAYNELISAEKLNPYNDLYHTDLAQINFALANAITSAKTPTEGSPAGSLSDQDKQNISVLLQQSINEGKSATALSPRSALNWEILGLLYRQIAGVAQNALVFSLDSYGKAIFQDPLNPQLRLNVGGVYYATQNYDMAIRFFTDSINLKPDFANGYYNLSVALRDKGDLVTAQSAAEKVITLIDPKSADYKIASDYLNELKNKVKSTQVPPAAETTGSLQQEQLPKVVDVGTPPEKIATPSAVKKPNSTP